MTKKNRILFPGGFAAALTLHRMVAGLICLASLLTGCPGPMQPVDTGMPPDNDGGMPLDDADVPPPDAWNPPRDGGMDVPDTGTVGDCTPEMMRDRVTPPCDPDTRTGAGTGPTGLEGFVGFGMTWFSPSGSCGTNMIRDAMDRILLEMVCNENGDIPPYYGIYYYDLDGDWYANYQNRATQEWSHLRVDPGPIAVVELFHAGEDTPYQTFMAAP